MTIIIDGTVGANKAVVLDSAGKLPAIDGSLVTTLNATQVTTGSIATARIDTGTTSGKFLVLDGSGNMPAIAAGAMTGVESATKSASDPTISTNPATGLGTKWINTTSGEIFILTDATAGANVWTSTGGTSGNVQLLFQGEISGYSVGGGGSPNVNVIEKYSFTTDGNATDVGDLAQARCGNNNVHSATYGYTLGGSTSPNGNPANLATIERHTFASGGNATAMTAVLTAVRSFGSTSCTNTYGYHAGNEYNSLQNVIEKFSMTADTNATDVGDLTITKGRHSGASSSIYGYSAGSWGPPAQNVIEKYSFSADGNATDVGNLTVARGCSGASSETHGYSCSGYSGSVSNVIDKWSFSSDGNATDVGDTTANLTWPHGTSSTTNGYCCGNGTYINKFSFTTDGNATNVGALTASRGDQGSQGWNY